MWSLFKKELKSFFSSITGYLVIIVFLTINGLFLWLVPSEYNILEYPYASLETMFTLSPWVFLFLVPAVCMQLFAEEKRTGTIELLMTKPISTFHIVLGKYLAAVCLVLLALLPSLIYLASIYFLANPIGNIDFGAVLGSYIGLFFLASVYCSIGVLGSSLSSNQVVAFIVSTALCFVMYIGFDFISSIDLFENIKLSVLNLGINEHYLSISRGVIDSRDLVYFLVVILSFIYMTHFSLLKSKK